MARLIDTDIPCAACGYNLRGLTDFGRCPECGRDVAGSVEVLDERRRASADLLTAADPRWVRNIIEGMLPQHSESRVPPTAFGMLELVRPWVREVMAGQLRMELFYLLLLPTLAAALLPVEFLPVWWVWGRRDAVMPTAPAALDRRTPASSRP